MYRSFRFAALAALLIVSAVGCSRCSTRTAVRSADEFVGADSAAALSIPSVGTLADRTQSLLDTVRAGPGGARLVALSANLSRQLGFDPLKREGLKAAGINPEGSFALAVSMGGQPGAYVVVPIADAKKLEENLGRLAADRTGATVREVRTVEEVKVTVLTREAGGPAEFAYAVKDGFLLLAAGEGAEFQAAIASQRKAEDSIARSEIHARSRERVGSREAYLFFPRAPVPGAEMAPDVIALGLGVSENELALRAYLALAGEWSEAVTEALVGGGKEFLAKLPANAPAYLRGGIDWSAVVGRLDGTEPGRQGLLGLREWASGAGVDVDEEVLSNLQPGFAVAFGLSQTVNLSRAFDFDPRRSNPLRNFTLLGVGQVKDGEKAAAVLEKAQKLVEAFGTSVGAREVDGLRLYTASYRLGEGLTWALKDDTIVVLGGFGDRTADVAAAVVSGKESGPSAEGFSEAARHALFESEGLSFALDMARIGEAVEKLPNSAFGTGPSALMARSVATGVIQPLTRLQAALAVSPTEGGVLVDLSAAVK